MRIAIISLGLLATVGCSVSPEANESESESAIVVAEDEASRFLVVEGTVALPETAVGAKGERSAVARVSTDGRSTYESGLWCPSDAPRCTLRIVARERDVFFRRPDGRTDGVHLRVRGRLEARLRDAFPELCDVSGLDSRGVSSCVLWKISATRRAFGSEGVERSDGRGILAELGLDP